MKSRLFKPTISKMESKWEKRFKSYADKNIYQTLPELLTNLWEGIQRGHYSITERERNILSPLKQTVQRENSWIIMM